jgi:hypothetical protein
VPDSYSGPGIIFIKKDLNKDVASLRINLIDGLAAISKDKMRRKFVFISANSKKEIEVIPIGKEDIAGEDQRYIFRLFHETFDSYCDKAEINVVTFFVGTKADFLQLNGANQNPLDLYNSKGNDWCDFYKGLN